MRVRRSIPSASVAAAVALGLVTLTACGGGDSSPAGADGKVDVVASFYPMQFLAERIGGAHVDVTTLTRPGTEPHDLELKPRQIGELGEADYVLYLKGLQPAVDEAIDQAEVRNKVDAGSLTTLESHGASTEGHSHEHGEEGHGEEGHGEEGHGEEGHEHEHEGGTDPHVWLDPVKYAEIAKGVGDSLAKADPDHAADYEKNTDALVKELTALDTAYRTGLENTATRTFITTHAAFGYLAERYGLDQEGISGVSPESEPSPARIKALQSIARKDKVNTVFFETLASDRTAKTLAKDTGLKTDVLDPLEGITDRSKGEDYLQVMQANLTALKKSLGAR
ncbi:metal ABC transporter substrate-binding protein [Streptomyces sp. ODS05-4]|uniref:metal ABC transporter substrate-binding protein n=1 Tax=Streptomyces sp. ODS05-4 TaxID=2944939 RepID=UPI00210908F1|nr:metal ABC transporter substrate-binding protein [Streptomyces sp. ODS05-4]